MTLPKPKDFKPVRVDKRQTAPDVPDAHPFDTSPQSEAEAVHQMKVEAALAGMRDALAKGLRWITLQEFADMVDLVPVLEGELPEIDGQRHGMFLFSCSGRIGAEKYERCLLAGGAWLVSAANPTEARRMAEGGVRDAQVAANQYAFAQEMGMSLSVETPADGISLETKLPRRH